MSLATGRPAEGRADHRGHAGDRGADPARRGHRRPHAARRHRGRVRRQLRRHVGPPARRGRGREHPAAGGRALLPHHRAGRRRGRDAAGAGGSGLLRLLPRGGRRADARAVRAGVRAVEGRRHSGGLLVRRTAARLGPHGAVPGEGDATHPGLDGRRGAQVLLRPGELHAGPAADRRGGARTAQLLRRGGPQLDRHPDRRRARPGAGPLDRRRPARRRRHRVQHRPAAPRTSATPEYRATRTVEALGTGLPVPLPGPVDAHRPRRQAVARCTTGWSSGARTSGTSAGGRVPDWYAPGGRRADGRRAVLGPAELVPLLGSRAPRDARGRDLHGHVVHVEVPRAGPRRRPRAGTDLGEPGRRGLPASSRTPSGSTRAARSRPT